MACAKCGDTSKAVVLRCKHCASFFCNTCGSRGGSCPLCGQMGELTEL